MQSYKFVQMQLKSYGACYAKAMIEFIGIESTT